MNASRDLKSGSRARAAGLLLAWAFTAAGLFHPASAAADRTIENTARVSFELPSGARTLSSNTVVTEVMQPPVSTRATLQLRRYDPGIEESARLPVAGGQCLVAGGDFGPLPAPRDLAGTELGADELPTGATSNYYVGEALVLVVNDPVGNADPAVRDFITAELGTSTGDAETIRLRETGVDTGVFTAAVQGVPMPPEPTRNDCALSLVDGARITFRYADSSNPLDALEATALAYAAPAPGAALRLENTASRDVVEIGDFLQYTLVLRNISGTRVFDAVLRDVLPPGLRFQAGSLRMVLPVERGPAIMAAADGSRGKATAAADPAIAADGRGLVIPVGDMPPGSEAVATFVAEVGPGARGPTLVNLAVGSAAGSPASNPAEAMVRMVESLNTSAFTIVGRVLAGDSCDLPRADRQGVANVRVFLDDGTFATTDADGAYHFEGVRPGTHVAQLDPATLPRHLEPAACGNNTRHAGRSFSQFVEAQGGMLVRADFHLAPKPATSSEAGTQLALEVGPQLGFDARLDGGASPFLEQERIRAGIPDAIAAAGGGNVDWFAGQQPGHGILFPAAGYNPRNPATRVVVKHLPGESVRVRINGAEAPGLNFDGSSASSDGRLAVSSWRALPLREGDNLVEAEVLDASGTVVARVERGVYFAGMPASAELVPEQSILVADGIHGPVIAVRLRDRRGHPVRDGITGPYALTGPYMPARTVREMQERQLGARSDAAIWQVEGDDGIAYIELQPTTAAGMVKLGFRFGGDGDTAGQARHELRQELEAWLKSAPRDWIVVGFAKGSVGYDTLEDNMQPLPPEDETGVRGGGQVSLYAKGRVLGKWLLTLAYDSDKPSERLRDRSLLSTIDPGRYYTLYGDGSQQGYDAASARKLYLKLERDQFYALFGDFQTGLDGSELSRYQRTVNGMKVEYRGPLLEFTGFAAETAQSHVRDELQGDGTSGLYRLAHRKLVLNSERVRIETRDRYHGERIVESRDLVRHVDYDIDYEAGTLFFREPIASRDFDFNPNWVVVDYETRGRGEKHLNGGGRVGIRALDGRLEAGASYLRDEDESGRSRLLGVDAKFRPTPGDELRAEFASTDGEGVDGETGGNAWLLEWQHRGERYDLLAYLRRNERGFGLGHQNAFESGMAKAGVQGQWRIGPGFTLQGEAYRLEDLSSGATRNAANVAVVRRSDDWTMEAGLQWARDQAADGREAESRQVTLGVRRALLGQRLQLGVRGEFGIGGRNESVDFPTRLQLDASYALTPGLRLLAAQEFTDGKDRDTATARFGFEARPWKDATLTTTLNQSQVSEYGPRSFALFGLNQKFRLNQRWSFDVALDSAHAFSESGEAPLVVDPSQPIQVGGIRDGGALTEDFVALSGGATYHGGPWMWNLRLEGRQAEDNDRYGFTTAFLREVRDGVALSASAQAFSQDNANGSSGLLANAQLAWAYRPPGSAWSMLDKLEYRLDALRRPGGDPQGDMRSARIVNNFVLNYASDAWQSEDGTGSVLDLYQRSELSLYYGSKYVLDSFGGDEYSGYTDLLGAEWRFDLSPSVDIGLRASVLHSWKQRNFAWAIGPNVGFSPFPNAWVSLGYNLRGFHDRDFEDAHHTAKGAYLVFRMKFDQRSLGLDGDGARR